MDLGHENWDQTHLDSQKPQKGPRLSQNDAKWDSLKAAIHQIYMIENKTLPETMQLIEERHGFKASERKWKTKWKEWKFDKYLSDADKRIIVAKAGKRALEGKDTNWELQKVKVSKDIEAVSPGAETPECITYHTPKEERNSSILARDDVQTIIYEAESLQFPVETDTVHSENPTSERTHAVLDQAFSTIANISTMFDLPIFAEKYLLELTKKSGSVAASIALAVEADHSGDVFKAIPAYIDAIEHMTRIEGQGFVGVSLLRCRLAENYSKLGLVDSSVSTYIQAISNIAFGNGITGRLEYVRILAMEDLAGRLCSNKQYGEAEAMFGQASERFRRINFKDDSVNCQFLRAKLLQKVGKDSQALSLLYEVLIHRLDHAITTGMFEISDVAGSIAKSYKNLNNDSRWSVIISDWNYLIIASNSSTLNYSSSPKVIEAIIHIADALSSMGEFDKANSLLLVALVKTHQWAIDDDTKYIKAICNYAYAKLLAQQRNHSKTAFHLLLALETLEAIDRNGGKLTVSTRQRLERIYVEFMNWVGTSRSPASDAITAIETLLIELDSRRFQEDSATVVRQSPEVIILD